MSEGYRIQFFINLFVTFTETKLQFDKALQSSIGYQWHKLTIDTPFGLIPALYLKLLADFI